MASEPLIIEFDEGQHAPVVVRMAEMAAAGAGWLNLTPGLAMAEPPPDRGPLTALLGSRGPTVPLATWTPASGREPPTAGIHHAEGPRAMQLLGDRGLPLPEGWRVLQDHPKRGLVVTIGTGQDRGDLDATLSWLVTATGLLCPWPRTGEWRALCYLR